MELEDFTFEYFFTLVKDHIELIQQLIEKWEVN